MEQQDYICTNMLTSGGVCQHFYTPPPLPSTQDKLESVLDLSHQQMEQYLEQPCHSQKIAYQQRLLQEDLVSIRAQISRLSTVRTVNTVHLQYTQYTEYTQSTQYTQSTHSVFDLFALCVMQEMSLAWEEYGHLERSVEQLRTVLQAHMSHSATPQVRPGIAVGITGPVK